MNVFTRLFLIASVLVGVTADIYQYGYEPRATFGASQQI